MEALNMLERLIDRYGIIVMIYGIPLGFIVFLILALVQIPKVKRKKAKPVKLIVFGIIATVFLFATAVEIFLFLLLAAAVSHM